MNSILFNLSGKIEKPLVDALYALKDVADSLEISFFVVGASARDLILKHCYGIEPPRKTGDIDLGVQVANWEQFKELTESLIGTGRFSPTKDTQRFLCGLILIDIVPFGPITGDDKRIVWPPEHKIIMSMAGFEEAYEYSVTVRLSSDPELDIKVSTLSGLAIMKLISWKENHPERKRDAGDLLLIMNKYEEAGNSERLYGEQLPLLLEEDFDARMAGIRLLGRDIAKICDVQTLRIIKSTLDAEIDDQSQFKLISDMMRESGMPEARFDEILIRLEKLKQGIVEVGGKSLKWSCVENGDVPIHSTPIRLLRFLELIHYFPPIPDRQKTLGHPLKSTYFSLFSICYVSTPLVRIPSSSVEWSPMDISNFSLDKPVMDAVD